ncbi:MAG: DUF58 domain-containing protein [Myxococcota bacterium]
MLSRLRPPRKLRFTREGKYFVLITFGVGVAAINTGNNLLYLVLGMLLALIIVSGVMSEFSLRKLTVTRRLPSRAQAGRSHLVEIEVFNRKRRFPSYAIEVEDLRAGQPTDKRCFFLKISPRSAQVAAYRRKPHRRGRDKHTGFRVATRFPFGLFEKSLHYPLKGELIIYPAVDPVRLAHDAPGTNLACCDRVGRGTGDEVMGLRPMREGDDPRDIYWRKSTVPNEFVLKERAREARPDALLSLDDLIPEGVNKDIWGVEFERRIREVASLAVALLRRGNGVKLLTASGRSSWGTPHVGADPILRFLALIEAVDESEIVQREVADEETRRDASTTPPARMRRDTSSSPQPHEEA